MKKPIRISTDPKRMFGAMAKPGEIVFGTHTHLITRPTAQPTIQQLLIEAQKKAKEAKLKHKAAQKASTNPIQIKITKLRHLESVWNLHQLHRAVALKEYNALQKSLKNKTTTDAREFIADKNSIYTLADRVKFIENLIDVNRSQQETIKRELTDLLRAPIELKAKKQIQVKRTAKKVAYTLEQQKNLDLLLDSLSEQKKLEAKLIDTINRLPVDDKRRVSYLEQLRGVRTNLRYLPGLLADESRVQTPKTKTRVEKAKEVETTALEDYQRTARILRPEHAETKEMRIHYLRAKRSRLYEEGRIAKGKKEKNRVDSMIRAVENEITKAQKEKERE